MKVLIADDEAKITQLILHLVNWSDYDMEVIGTAQDGISAYDIICREKPDIVITDIRMPGMEGIELVEKTQQILPGVFFVIVSGYSEFEYARQAVRLGVEEYLLKPVRRKDLQTVLEKISGKHRLLEASHREHETLKTELATTKDRIKNNLLQDLLFSDDTFFKTACTAEILDRYGCSTEASIFRMLLVHLYPNTADATDDELRFALKWTRDTLSERLAPCCLDLLSAVRNLDVIFLLSMKEDRKEEILRQLRKSLIPLSGIRELLPDAKHVLVMDSCRQSLCDSKDLLTVMQHTLLRRFREGDTILQASPKSELNAVPDAGCVTADTEKQLLREMELLHDEGVQDIISGVQHLLHFEGKDEACILTTWIQLRDTFLFGIQNYYKDTVQPETAVYYMEGLNLYYSMEDAFFWLEKEIGEYIKSQAKKKQDTDTLPIRQAKQYIHDHLRDAVSLETVSREAGLNPAYLSTVFKKETGQNFSDYVTGVRIEEAKTLLTRTNKDIIDIAEDVGYADVKYFSKLFKRRTGLTPSSYRKLYQ